VTTGCKTLVIDLGNLAPKINVARVANSMDVVCTGHWMAFSASTLVQMILRILAVAAMEENSTSNGRENGLVFAILEPLGLVRWEMLFDSINGLDLIKVRTSNTEYAVVNKENMKPPIRTMETLKSCYKLLGIKQ
jgi:hypothetical protein